MSVLQRRELEDSPLADLHAIASELGIEGYRALRREDLIAAILSAQGGEPEPADDGVAAGGEESAEAEAEAGPEPAAESPGSGGDAAEEAEGRAEEPDEEEQGQEEERLVSGTLDILPNGSGFIRVDGMVQSNDDVYVSPAQIRRCELRAGDEVGGPLRPARRNERHPSLVRVQTVNERDAEPPEERPLFSELTPVHPSQRLQTSAALAEVPFGRGSRVAIAGAPGAGATRLLAETARTLRQADEGLLVLVALVGARPEEITEWQREVGVPVMGGSFDRSIDAQTQAADLAVERAKRVAERGGDAVVIVDSLENLPAGSARRLFGAARKLEEGGSLTVIAAVGGAPDPLRQASTRITLDAAAPEPTVLVPRSRTQRADLLA